MTYQRTVRLADTDAAGVVYFCHVLSMCHEAYETAVDGVNLSLRGFLDKDHLAFPIVHSEIDFFRPLFWGDQVRIDLTPQLLQDDTFEILYQITSPNSERNPVATAKTRHVCLDFRSRKKNPLPESLKQWLSAF